MSESNTVGKKVLHDSWAVEVATSASWLLGLLKA